MPARCEIRGLVMHLYPDSIKAYGYDRLTVYVGRSGKSVHNLRTIPIARAHELAMKLQGRFGIKLPVVWGWGFDRTEPQLLRLGPTDIGILNQ